MARWRGRTSSGLGARRRFNSLVVFGVAGVLGACGPVGAVGDIVFRDQKDSDRHALAEKIRRHWLAQDAGRFGDLKASVSYSTDWQKFFRPQYTLVLTGSVLDEADREIAVVLAREALGVESHRVYVTNAVRVELNIPSRHK